MNDIVGGIVCSCGGGDCRRGDCIFRRGSCDVGSSRRAYCNNGDCRRGD